MSAKLQSPARPKCYSYIRFSTPEQRLGDSLRRQLSYAEDFTEKRGFRLDDTLSLRDEGISAFHGMNKSEGYALGQFLGFIKTGRIAPGSILIVESLDRLSREDVLTAFNLFTQIIRAGITIVTAQDNMEYTEESVKQHPTQIMLSITVMMRAHEESQTKSKRLAQAWQGKREKAVNGKQKLTGRTVGWLRLSDDKTRFELIPERVQIIEQIFKMKAEGMGKSFIAKWLNQNNSGWIPARNGNQNGWRESYVRKILSSRAVIGELQPHKLEHHDSKDRHSPDRKPVGEVIQNYYPRIISDELFYSVQKQFEKNKQLKNNGGGKISKGKNLFTYLLRCGYCKGPMTFMDKGGGAQYLVCDNARRGRGCEYASVRYGEVEHVILEHCKGLRAQDILPDSSKTASEIQQLKSVLVATEAKINEAEFKAGNITDTISMTTDKRNREILDKKLTEILDKKEKLEDEKKSLHGKIDSLSQLSDNFEMTIEDLKGLFTLMETVQDEERIILRMKLKNELRSLIERIDLYPYGFPNRKEGEIARDLEVIFETYPEMRGTEETERVVAAMRARIGNKDYRLYQVLFKGGSRRSLMPARRHSLVMDIDVENDVFRTFDEYRDGIIETAFNEKGIVTETVVIPRIS